MKNRLYALFIFLLLIIFVGCGSEGSIDGECITTADDSSIDDSDGLLRVVGRVTYDRVGVNSNGRGLNYSSITKEAAKQVVVKLIGDGKSTLETTTDDNGTYEFTGISKNSCIKVIVLAKLKKSGNGSWDLKVVDNTNGSLLYAIESSSYSIGDDSIRVDLNAPSGWDGSSYSKTRAAAPFAILGSIYQGMQKVISADSGATFPSLVVNWSKNNIASVGSLEDGQIQTSHFNCDSLYILGDANGDTDEYDNHVVIHEWGHYFEAKFSRTDSIGGNHAAGDKLDIRVAFGEGWGNAFSAIATDDTIYYDTLGNRQANGWFMDIESQVHNSAGWYSEASIQRILYDLYDSHDDGADRLSLGFRPIYNVLIGAQKNTEAFTSIFSFVTALKDEESTKVSSIDDILSGEDILPIVDIYGDSHHNLYSDIEVGAKGNVCTQSDNGSYNKLYNHKYIRFTIHQDGIYKVRVSQSNGRDANPDFTLYKVSTPFSNFGLVQAFISNTEEIEYSLTEGKYILDVFDYNNLSYSCFDITVNN